jgi:aerobic C4-dicarboxylate transport protein
VIPTIPVAGMALILGIDRFLSMFRAVVNMIGNGVATIVVARWETELTPEDLRNNLDATTAPRLEHADQSSSPYISKGSH